MKTLPDIDRSSALHDNGDTVIQACEKQFSYHSVCRVKNRLTVLAEFYVAGDVCLARALDHFKQYNIPTIRVIDQRELHRLRVLEHLKDVGMKP